MAGKLPNIDSIDMDLVEWFHVGCHDGDTLKLVKTKCGNVGLQNTRTKVLFFITDESVPSTFTQCGVCGGVMEPAEEPICPKCFKNAIDGERRLID